MTGGEGRSLKMKFGMLTVGAVLEDKKRRTKRAAKDDKFRELFDRAMAAGMAAGNAAKPVPMMVTQHKDPTNDRSLPVAMWHVPDGVCGFAWVKLRPGTTSFARWLLKNKLARKDYYGGVAINMKAFNQSMERKLAAAEAMAEVFRTELGVSAYADSRMD